MTVIVLECERHIFDHDVDYDKIAYELHAYLRL